MPALIPRIIYDSDSSGDEDSGYVCDSDISGDEDSDYDDMPSMIDPYYDIIDDEESVDDFPAKSNYSGEYNAENREPSINGFKFMQAPNNVHNTSNNDKMTLLRICVGRQIMYSTAQKDV